MKTKRAIIIDAHKHEVREEQLPETGALKDLQRIVEGFIERVIPAPNTELYVNEEGLLHGETDFFSYAGQGPFAGNGVVYGGKAAKNESLESVRGKVQFMKLREGAALEVR